MILAGAARVLAAKTLGVEKIPVLVASDLNEAQKRAYALADNKIAANAGWDRAVLAAELGELGELLPRFGLDFEITGFEPAEIDALLGDFSDPEHDAADEVPPVASQSVSARGDLWQLGPHRMLCGDALSASDFETLMGRDRSAMVIADSPYNVVIKKTVGRGKIKHSEFRQASGEMNSSQFSEFLGASMSLTAIYTIDGAPAFWFMDWRHQREILAAGENAYAELLNLVVWAKTNGGQGSLYRSAHELIFVFKSKDGSHLNNVQLGKFGRNRTNVWRYPGVNTFRKGRLEELSVHPTVKPVAMIADAMRDCSRRGDIVLDPFLGSGTTIIAAEQVGRRAFGIEIEPLYVDVAIRRWQQITKRDAILKSTGETFDEVSELALAPRFAERRMKNGKSKSPPRRIGLSTKRRADAHRDLIRSGGDNAVGYGKPPLEHAWKPGQSGNPKGRAKGSKNESTILREILARKIESRSAGRSRKITVVEGILLRITEDALKGNTKSATFLLNRYAAMVSGELQTQDLNTDDREVLQAFAERFAQRSRTKDRK